MVGMPTVVSAFLILNFGRNKVKGVGTFIFQFEIGNVVNEKKYSAQKK